MSITQLSKFLSLILRHKPQTIGILLDKNGWANVDELIAKMNVHGTKIDMQLLEYVVENNNKKRYAFNDDKTLIRASQGHSIEVDLEYEPQIPPDVLYHGTGEKNVQSILKFGIKKMKRHHVHLSSDVETAVKVGKRHGNPVVFVVHSKEMHNEGFVFYISENGVWLTEFVPKEFVELIKETYF